MRIIYNKSAGILSEAAQSRLQNIFTQDAVATSKMLHEIFPQQTITARNGRIQVTKRDGSIILDILHDGSIEAKWIEAAVNLRMTAK